MLKVKFENHSSGGVRIFGSPEIDIPGTAVGENAVTVGMPETPKSESLVNDIKRRYPAMVVTIVDEEGGETPLSGAGGGEQNAGDDGAETTATALMTADDFANAVEGIEKKSAGWCIINVNGFVEPIKVQVKADDDPIAAAYAVYAAKAGE